MITKNQFMNMILCHSIVTANKDTYDDYLKRLQAGLRQQSLLLKDQKLTAQMKEAFFGPNDDGLSFKSASKVPIPRIMQNLMSQALSTAIIIGQSQISSDLLGHHRVNLFDLTITNDELFNLIDGN